MKPPPARVLMVLPVAAALGLGVALTWLAWVAARTLGERDQAVRDGVLLRLGHALEAELREAGPAEPRVAMRSFLEAHADALRGVELAGPHGVVVREGEVGTGAFEHRAMLGPGWRGALGVGGAGPGRGPQAVLRLQPREVLGSAGRLAPVILISAVAAAVALVGFAVFGVAGLEQRRKLASSQAERERLELVAGAGAGLAHRIRNPLAGIKGTAQLLAADPATAVAARGKRVLEACERIEALLARLLDFARPPEADPAVIDLAALGEKLAGRLAGAIRVTAPGPTTAWADPEHVESIAEELLANARAFDPGGELSVSIRREGRLAVMEVADRGPGLSVEAEQAFRPYVTTRAEGTGLGLPIVRALARANGGDVTLAPRPGGGCIARLVLPAEGP
ncbi:MAG TPA: HAMP domain-containing sensor histidine kinase [Thermoanaerobaculaceae bacterium]|nr:HAMP domain-containing sensor histidine kinase [Thermoanaerobaculaceae bacterium]HRS16434.1 HAMP domain-containing sensor histidine kinase [Thermoanaerobaculaceae bacterium]